MPTGIENGIAYLVGLKVGDLYGSNYMTVSNTGVITLSGTSTIVDGSATVENFKSINIAYDATNYFTLSAGSTGAGKITAVGSADSFEIETGDGKIILDAGTDIDLDPAGNDINLLGSGAGKITLAATTMTIYGGDTTGDALILQGNSADATEKITITGASGITLAGAIKLDGTVTFDDDGTIADAANVMTITQNTITLAAATKINIDGNADITGYNLTGLVDLVSMGLGGDVVLDTFPFNTVTLTEAASTFAKVDDGGDFQDLATSSAGAGITANYQLFPDVEVENDACYFGAAAPFGAIYMDMSATVAVYGADSLTWEYYNGSTWSALTILWDDTDITANDGLRSFQADGYIIFSAPTDWAANEVDSQSAYWIRARCNATVNITTIPLTNSKEHQIPSDANAFELPYDGTISRCRFQWDIPSTGTADTKFILYNFTTGAASAIQTITKALIDFQISDIAMTVAAGNELGIYICQVDGGGTEYGDGLLEMKVTRT